MHPGYASITAGLILCSAAIPLTAQSPSAYVHPPLHRGITPNSATPTGFSPAQMRAAYDFTIFKNGGAGQTIGIVDAYEDPSIEADLGVFTAQFKLRACTTANGCFVKVKAPGVLPDTTGWSNEVAIDVEWAHAMAPAAKILLVEARTSLLSDMYAAVDLAVQNGATVVSMSWIAGEYAAETSDDVHFMVPGVTFVAASGDAGTGAQYPAASPFVVAVGGTTLTVNPSTHGWQSETGWGGSGGGPSAYEPEPFYQVHSQISGQRGTPDVAYDGDPNTGVPAYSSYYCGNLCYIGWTQWGGTSIGTPQWAALFAIANAQRVLAGKATLTLPQRLLYTIAQTDYHDITTGTNGTCGARCTARSGYDFVTGMGSPKASLVIPDLVAAP
jgi:subtilase family serine protease